jgi:hypothetical protein
MIRQSGGARQGGGRAMRVRGEQATRKGGRGVRRQGGVARGGGGGGKTRPIPTARTRLGHGDPNASVQGDGGGPTKTQQPVECHGSDSNATAANRSANPTTAIQSANPTTAIRTQPWQVEDEGEGIQCPQLEFPDETTFRTPTTICKDQQRRIEHNDDA